MYGRRRPTTLLRQIYAGRLRWHGNPRLSCAFASLFSVDTRNCTGPCPAAAQASLKSPQAGDIHHYALAAHFSYDITCKNRLFLAE